jgi:alkylation response protein AidB-like acyl-CoA dehydrogenase
MADGMAPMPSLLLSRADLAFLLYDWLDAAALTRRGRHADHSRETFEAALDTYEAIAAERFANHNKKADQCEPRLEAGRVVLIPEVGEAMRAFSQAGLMAAGHDYELGGMQLPCVVEKAGFAILSAANIGTAAFAMLTIGNANLLLAHGSRVQRDRWIRPQLEGRYFGTMCLSEPQAGSSLADIRTRAEPQPDGSFRLFGNKMWISGAEHELAQNIVHLVLAKVPDGNGELPAGVRGISLFIVPRRLVGEDGSAGEANDVVLAGLNHKMGYRGMPNGLLNFGEGRHRPGGRAGAVGYPVGRTGEGLACMFHMMNEARIAVGLGAAALGCTAYLHALDYARNRPQGRLPGNKDPRTAPVAIIRHADVRRMLVAQKAYAEGALALVLYCARLVDEQRTAEDAAARDDAGHLLDLLTPMAKSWPSQWCLEANSLAIQVHGGYGYTRDYNVEQFYRDNRLNAIHEGTHGIQGLDLLGRKVRLNEGLSMRLLDRQIQATLTAARTGNVAALADHAASLSAAWQRLQQATRSILGQDDDVRRLANSSPYLEAFGHLVVAWIWLGQAVAAAARLARQPDEREACLLHGKLQTCRYFYLWELPRIGPMLELLERLDTCAADMKDEWF